MRVQIQKFYYATFNYFLIAIGLSVGIFLVQFGPAMLASGDEETPQYAQLTIMHYVTSWLDRISSVPLLDLLINMIIWGAVGLAVYTVFYLLANIWIDTHNEMVSQALNSVEGSSAVEVFKQSGGKLFSAIAYLLFVGVSFIYLIDIWMNALEKYVFSGMEVAQLPYLALGLAALCLNIYVILVGAYLIWKRNEMV